MKIETMIFVVEVACYGMDNQAMAVKFDTGRTMQSPEKFRAALTTVLPAIKAEYDRLAAAEEAAQAAGPGNEKPSPAAPKKAAD